MAGVAPPDPHSHIIERPRLLKKLDEAQGRLILLVAPAGYGKTTLARQWFRGREATWYQASPHSADVAALAEDLAEAFTPLAPDATERMKRRLQASPAPESEARSLCEFFVELLHVADGSGWLVVDDYHHLMEQRPAEEFFERLADSNVVRMFLVSRRRPTWLSSRTLIYGDAAELGTDALAMTPDEGLQLFTHERQADAKGLLQHVKGWPAVLALAARTGGPLRSRGMPQELHAFFAEELYSTVDEPLRRGLQRLAILTGMSQQDAARAIGDGQWALAAGAELGFVTLSGMSFDIHPLLRDFLIEQLRGEDDYETVVADCIERLMSLKLWSEAFELAVAFDSATKAEDVVRAGRKPLLAIGRLSTLTRWVSATRALNSTSVELDLIEAEIAVRQGRFLTAEFIATRAARSGAEASLLNECYSIAGTAAHLASRNEDAQGFFTEAREFATTDEERRRAQWGQFLAAHESNPRLATHLLDELEANEDESPIEALRLLTQKVMHAWRIGGLQEQTHHAEAGNILLSQTDDPMQRTAFLNAMAGAYNQLAQYKSGLGYANRLDEEARSSKLRFVAPYAQFAQANAYAGLRQYKRAEAAARQVVIDATETGDTYCIFNVRALRARMAIATGEFAHAVQLSDVRLDEVPLKALAAEYATTHALALAVTGHYAAAEASLQSDEANFIDGQVEALQRLARIVIRIRKYTSNAHEIDGLLTFLDTAGCIDAFVFTYRAVPELLREVAGRPRWRSFIEGILSSANDTALGHTLGFSGHLPGAPSALSPRELEVLGLVVQGLRNREIGKRLFISEVTVKAHLRRIYAKLGVRSRTEAVIAAADLSAADPEDNNLAG